MSAIAAIIPGAPRNTRDAEDARSVHAMLSAMRGRGHDRINVAQVAGATLGVARFEWEMAPGFSDAAMVVTEGDLTIVADATLYRLDALDAALGAAGARAAGTSPTHRILAAYRAWGADAPAHVEGDFAFVVWDARERRVVAARDRVAMRGLHWAMIGGDLVIASAVRGVLAHPDCPADVCLEAVGDTVARMFESTDQTCFTAVKRLFGAHTMRWSPGDAAPRIARHWTPPRMDETDDPPFERAAAELRRLIERAVAERIPDGQSASVWLSGGWDSSALFAAGQSHLAPSGAGDRLRAVSLTYPEGDPGREDDIIEAILARWNARTHWVDTATIPLLHETPERAADRDDAFAHPYENWTRALADGTRAVGSHVALMGIGGDELFAGNDQFLADLARRGRVVELAREWRSSFYRYGAHYFAHVTVIPNVPRPALKLAARLLRGGRPIKRFSENRLPLWYSADFARRHRVEERDEERELRAPRMGVIAEETFGILVSPALQMIREHAFSFALEQGVEIRIPLHDADIIALAVRRPLAERRGRGESKRLLRAAMRGLLPNWVLAKRATRTGTTGGYFDRHVRQNTAPWFLALLDDPLLASIGIVDRDALRDGWTRYQKWGEDSTATRMYATLQAEIWARKWMNLPVARADSSEDGVPASVHM